MKIGYYESAVTVLIKSNSENLMYVHDDHFLFLGSSDPEMDRIQEVCDLIGIAYVIALKNGKRVHGGNAYNADNSLRNIPEGKKMVFVECGIQGVEPDIVIDHHHPGDPGYDKTSTQFLEASSLGQFYALVGLNATQDDKVLAAIDHCFNAALRGQCPGVRSREVLNRRMASIHGQVDKLLERYLVEIAEAPVQKIGEQDVFFFAEHLGIGYSLEYLIAHVVAVMLDVPVVLRSHQNVNGKERFHLCGGVSKETVIEFAVRWAPEHGLESIYHVAERGFAGGYK